MCHFPEKYECLIFLHPDGSSLLSSCMYDSFHNHSISRNADNPQVIEGPCKVKANGETLYFYSLSYGMQSILFHLILLSFVS